MLTDYKFVVVTKTERSTQAIVRFYEGEVNTLNVPDINGIVQPVTRYRRSKLLGSKVLDYPSQLSKADLVFNLNAELALSQTHTPIPEQSNV